MKVSQCATTGMKYFEPENIVLYPNPVLANNGSFTIQGLAEGEYGYAIENYLGQVVAHGEVKDNQVQCPVYLKKSIYFVAIANKRTKQTMVKKMVVD